MLKLISSLTNRILFLIGNWQQEDQLTKAGDNSASVENPTDEWDSINLYSKGVPRDLNLGLNFGDCYIGLEKVGGDIPCLMIRMSLYCALLSDQDCVLDQFECCFF